MDMKYRMTDRERTFAARNHGLLLRFMQMYSLDQEYYGQLSLRYLKTVRKYLIDSRLQHYSFSTILWWHLRSELNHIRRKHCKEPLIVHHEEIPDVVSPETDVLNRELRTDIESELTSKQLEVLRLYRLGMSRGEIAELCGIGKKAVTKRMSRMRKRAFRILGQE